MKKILTGAALVMVSAIPLVVFSVHPCFAVDELEADFPALAPAAPIPATPTPTKATADLVDSIKQRIDLTDGRLQAAFVVSRAIKGTRIGEEVSSALAGYGLPVLASRITQRVSFPGTAASGTTVLDAEPHSGAAKEIRALADEIQKLF